MEKTLTLFLALCLISSLHAQTPGTLDPLFGDNSTGIKVSNFGESSDVCWAAARQTDGKILLAGSMDKGRGNEPVVIRLLPNGALDATFGTKTIGLGGSGATIYAIAIQTDGKILVAGEVLYETNVDLFVARLTPNGTSDASFGNLSTGFASLDLGGQKRDDRANGILLQSDGKIVLTGMTASSTSVEFTPFAIRFNTNGTLDNTYGTNGWYEAPAMKQSIALFRTASGIHNDGKATIVTHRANPQNLQDNIVIIRLTSAGKPDNTFGINGLKELPNAGNDLIYHLVIQPDGKILMGGFQTSNPSSLTDMLVARCHADGRPDSTFSDDGFYVLSISETIDRIYSIVSDNTGQIFAAASAESPTGFTGPQVVLLRLGADGKNHSFAASSLSGTAPNTRSVLFFPDGKKLISGTASNDFALARFGTDHQLDPTFGNNGSLRYPLAGLDNEDLAIALLPDGKFLTAGENAGRMAVSKRLSNGQLDTSFGKNGLAELNLLNGRDVAYAVHTSPDGKIWLSGTASNNTLTQVNLAVARFTAAGIPDSTFDSEGFVLQGITPLFDVKTSGLASALQPDGKIVVGGKRDGGGFVLMRFQGNGALDATFGTSGKVETQFFGTNFTQEEVAKIVILPNGKILAIGTGNQTSSGRARFLMARYNANGQLDNTFGQNGLQNTDIGNGNVSFALAVTVLPSGKILLAGGSYSSNSLWSLALAQYTSSGNLDIGFGNSGIALLHTSQYIPKYATDLIVQPDGNFLLSGFHQSTAAVFRVKSDGTPDNSFGIDGIFSMPVLPGSFGSAANAALVQSDGKLLAVGNKSGLDRDALAFRLLTGIKVGTLDAPHSLAAPLLFPNPVRDGSITLEYELPSASEVYIELFDLQGKKLAILLKAERFSGKNTETLVLPNNLANGHYLLNLQAEKGNLAMIINVLGQ